MLSSLTFVLFHVRKIVVIADLMQFKIGKSANDLNLMQF